MRAAGIAGLRAVSGQLQVDGHGWRVDAQLEVAVAAALAVQDIAASAQMFSKVPPAQPAMTPWSTRAAVVQILSAGPCGPCRRAGVAVLLHLAGSPRRWLAARGWCRRGWGGRAGRSWTPPWKVDGRRSRHSRRTSPGVRLLSTLRRPMCWRSSSVTSSVCQMEDRQVVSVVMTSMPLR